MNLDGSTDVHEALALVGELLATDGHQFAVTILGGAALNLLGIVERTTDDVDILADLLALRPSTAELNAATVWVRTQDASPAFSDTLDRVVTHVRTDLGHG